MLLVIVTSLFIIATTLFTTPTKFPVISSVGRNLTLPTATLCVTPDRPTRAQSLHGSI